MDHEPTIVTIYVRGGEKQARFHFVLIRPPLRHRGLHEVPLVAGNAPHLDVVVGEEDAETDNVVDTTRGARAHLHVYVGGPVVMVPDVPQPGPVQRRSVTDAW